MDITYKKIAVIITVLLLILLIFQFNNTIDKTVKKQRPDFIRDYKIYEIQELNHKTLVYSYGIVNKEKDNMYFVDVLDRNLLGYYGIDSRGHINRNIGIGQDFEVSLQLLTHDAVEQSIIFGIIKNSEIKDISIISIDSIKASKIFEFTDRTEEIYSIVSDKKLSNVPYLIVHIQYNNENKAKEILLDNKQMNRLKEGQQIYL